MSNLCDDLIAYEKQVRNYVASVPNRDEVVAEICIKHEFIFATVFKEDGIFKIEFYNYPMDGFFEAEVEDIIEVIGRAKKLLSG